MQPLIGIVAAAHADARTGWVFNRALNANVQAVERAGGLPVLIPSDLAPETLRAIYETLHGVLLPGGGDVDPATYNRPRGPVLFATDAVRDRTEVSLARWSVEEDRPLFGICRGMQILNVALGGTLIQDIPSTIETPLRHSIDVRAEEPRDTRLHTVTVDPDSRLAAILGENEVRVNSIHHQAVDDLAPDVRLTARAEDGLIEGMELSDRQFVLAVQWHPEDLAADDPQMQSLFNAFVEAARARL